MDPQRLFRTCSIDAGLSSERRHGQSHKADSAEPNGYPLSLEASPVSHMEEEG
jgi:hypothetical protein